MFDKIEDVIAELAAGKMVLITDDQDRENEGDLILPAEDATPEAINFIVTHAKGILCAPLTRTRAIELNLNEMTRNSDPFGTCFTIRVDAQAGTTTGVSAADRARTARVLADPKTKPSDLNRPGHMFPLIAREGGVLVRARHTEATVDLMRLAGKLPVGLCCEIINEKGEMSRRAELSEFAKRWNLKMGNIADLIAFRRRNESLVDLVETVQLPTKYGVFTLHCFRAKSDGKEHLALVYGDISGHKDILVRVHSECLTGDVFHSLRCDCGEQLDTALQRIVANGSGILVYMRQEGRGIGLENTLHAYHLQQCGIDTVDANTQLGFAPDLREYGIGAQILRNLGVESLVLLTNNPKKLVGLEGHGLVISRREPLVMPVQPYDEHYMHTKRDRMEHLL